MIKKDIINEHVFLEQTTFYIYRTEEDQLQSNRPFLTTSSKEEFEATKKLIQNGTLKLRK